MVTGVTTEAIAGEKMIVTAGGVDTHVHYICPQLLPEALASGVTTLYGGGSGPASGTCATTCTRSIGRVLRGNSVVATSPGTGVIRT